MQKKAFLLSCSAIKFYFLFFGIFFCSPYSVKFVIWWGINGVHF